MTNLDTLKQLLNIREPVRSAYLHLKLRDESNAELHRAEVQYRPLTQELADSLALLQGLITDINVLVDKEEKGWNAEHPTSNDGNDAE